MISLVAVKDLFQDYVSQLTDDRMASKLFEKYPTTNASTGISFKENIIGKSWTIAYRKSETSPREPQLIKITVDTSKKPYDFNVNGQHTADPGTTYRL